MQELAKILAEHSPLDSDLSLQKLFKYMAKALAADDIMLIGTTQKKGSRRLQVQELLKGWRVVKNVPMENQRSLQETEDAGRRYYEMVKKYGCLDPITETAAKTAGTTRVISRNNVISDEGWSNHWIAADYLKQLGFSDRMSGIINLDKSTEAHYVVSRVDGKPKFGEKQEAVLADIIEFAKPITRHVMLETGAIPTQSALIPPSEIKLIRLLLSGKKEADIAQHFERTKDATHTAITRLFKKYAVSGRAEFTSLWFK